MIFWHHTLQRHVFGLQFFGAKISYKKRVHKTLVNLPPGGPFSPSGKANQANV